MKAKNRKSIQDPIDQATPSDTRLGPKLYRIDKADFLLQVMPSNVKSWTYRYSFKKKARAIGLGSASKVSFKEAEQAARAMRVLLDKGIDPLAERDRLKQAQEAEQTQRMTFRQCAGAYIEAHRGGWKSVKHAAQWTATLETYAYPTIGHLPVSEIEMSHLITLLGKHWDTKNETMVRVRNRIEME